MRKGGYERRGIADGRPSRCAVRAALASTSSTASRPGCSPTARVQARLHFTSVRVLRARSPRHRRPWRRVGAQATRPPARPAGSPTRRSTSRGARHLADRRRHCLARACRPDEAARDRIRTDLGHHPVRRGRRRQPARPRRWSERIVNLVRRGRADHGGSPPSPSPRRRPPSCATASGVELESNDRPESTAALDALADLDAPDRHAALLRPAHPVRVPGRSRAPAAGSRCSTNSPAAWRSRSGGTTCSSACSTTPTRRAARSRAAGRSSSCASSTGSACEPGARRHGRGLPGELGSRPRPGRSRRPRPARVGHRGHRRPGPGHRGHRRPAGRHPVRHHAGDRRARRSAGGGRRPADDARDIVELDDATAAERAQAGQGQQGDWKKALGVGGPLRSRHSSRNEADCGDAARAALEAVHEAPAPRCSARSSARFILDGATERSGERPARVPRPAGARPPAARRATPTSVAACTSATRTCCSTSSRTPTRSSSSSPCASRPTRRSAGRTDQARHAPAWRSLQPLPGRLFVVGDPKQSIYRFRRADIAQYLRAADQVGAQRVTLSANFRVDRAVIDWVNDVFGRADHVRARRAARVPAARRRAAGRRLGPRHGLGARSQRTTTSHRTDGSATSVPRMRCDGARPPTSPRGRPPALAEGWPVVDEDADELRPCRSATSRCCCRRAPRCRRSRPRSRAAAIPYRAENSLAGVRDAGDPRPAAGAAGRRRPHRRTRARRGAALARCSGAATTTCASGRSRTAARGTLGAGPRRARGPPGRSRRSATCDRSPSESAGCHRRDLLSAIADERRLLELALAGADARDVWRRVRFVVDQARAWADAGGHGVRRYLQWARLQADEGRRRRDGPARDRPRRRAHHDHPRREGPGVPDHDRLRPDHQGRQPARGRRCGLDDRHLDARRARGDTTCSSSSSRSTSRWATPSAAAALRRLHPGIGPPRRVAAPRLPTKTNADHDDWGPLHVRRAPRGRRRRRAGVGRVPVRVRPGPVRIARRRPADAAVGRRGGMGDRTSRGAPARSHAAPASRRHDCPRNSRRSTADDAVDDPGSTSDRSNSSYRRGNGAGTAPSIGRAVHGVLQFCRSRTGRGHRQPGRAPSAQPRASSVSRTRSRRSPARRSRAPVVRSASPGPNTGASCSSPRRWAIVCSRATSICSCAHPTGS